MTTHKRRLMLFRHGKSDWSDKSLKDFDRPLNPRGRSAVPKMAEFMNKQGFVPEYFYVSQAVRAQQTFELLSPIVTSKAEVVHDIAIYTADETDLISMTQQFPDEFKSACIVGHNTSMQDAATMLSGFGDEDLRAKMNSHFPTASLAVIEFKAEHWYEVMPGTGTLLNFTVPRDLGKE